jgi:hypothetical protein
MHHGTWPGDAQAAQDIFTFDSAFVMFESPCIDADALGASRERKHVMTTREDDERPDKDSKERLPLGELRPDDRGHDEVREDVEESIGRGEARPLTREEREAAARDRGPAKTVYAPASEIVVRQARPALSAGSVRDAYLITLNERGTLDFGRMAELLGPRSSEDNVRDALAGDGLIFDDPEGGWQTTDAYLSGNVKRKLATAQTAGVAEPRFQPNVDALQLVIPADIPPGQIEVRLGTHWIPPADVNQFLAEVLDAEEPRWSRNGSQFFNYVALSRAGARNPVLLRCEYIHDVDRVAVESAIAHGESTRLAYNSP